jgi:WD40 repeat protein
MRSRRPPCLEWREKLALRHEDLSPADQQALDAHVRTCEICASALADYHFFEARLDALPPPAIKPLPRLSPHFFEQSGKPGTKERARSMPASRPARPPQKPRQHKTASVAWRVLGIVALICLLLASGLLFRTIYLARLAEHPGGDTLLNLNQHTDLVFAVAWSPDGTKIATASADRTVKIWDAESGALICTYYGHSGEVYTLAWSPNGQEIASGGDDNTVQIWNSTCDSPPLLTYTGHTNAVYTLAWSPDGKEIISGSADNTAQIWSVARGKTLLTLQFSDHVFSVAWFHGNTNGTKIAIGDWNDTIQVGNWNVNTDRWTTLYSYRTSDAVNSVAWSPNGRYLVSGNQDDTAEVWDTMKGTLLYTYDGHSGGINSVAWSPDGQEIASGSNDHTVRIWSPFTRKTLMVYSEHSDDIWSVAWSPDGKEIVSGSWDHTAKVWKVVG